MRIYKIKKALEHLQTTKDALERSARTPVIVTLYNQCILFLRLSTPRYRKGCCAVCSSGENFGRRKCLLSVHSQRSCNRKGNFDRIENDGRQEVFRLCARLYFFSDLKWRIAKEYKENQVEARGFINGIRNYKKELSHMSAEYSSLLEHVNYLFSIGKKN